jgi:hypothetical protein
VQPRGLAPWDRGRPARTGRAFLRAGESTPSLPASVCQAGGAPAVPGEEQTARPLARAAFLFLSLALLASPLFAHGCHGDDIDHEPLLIPLRSNPEDR